MSHFDVSAVSGASSAPVVTPDDDNDLPGGICNILYTQTAGVLSYVDRDDNTISVFAVPANHYLMVQVARVLEATTATVQALYAPSGDFPATISDLAATAESDTSVLLAFTPAPGAITHRYRINGGVSVACDDNSGSQLVTGLTAEAQYDFQVRGTNTSGAGDWSNVATATTEPAVQVERFGALTPEGGGGVAVTGTSIVSGDPSGHWQISGGYLSPSAAGAAAGLDAGPYSLKLDNGGTVNVAVDANSIDILTQAEWVAFTTSALVAQQGKTIYLRPGISITVGTINVLGHPWRRANLMGLVIEGRDPSNKPIFDKFLFNGVQNVTLRYLKSTEAAEHKISMVGSDAFPVDNITIDACELSGVVGDPGTNVGFPDVGVKLITTMGSSGTASLGSFTITNNIIQWTDDGISVTSNRAGASITIMGNRVKYFLADGIAVAYGGRDTPVNVQFNCISHPMGRSPAQHVDGIRFIANGTAATDWTINVSGNIVYHGDSYGDMQCCLISDFNTGGTDSGKFYIATMVGNLFVHRTPHSLSVPQAKNCVIVNNTCVGDNLDTSPAPQIRVGYDKTSGTHRIERNITEGFQIGGAPTMSDNVNMGLAGATYSYASVFDGPGLFAETREELLSWFARKADGPADLAGPFDAGAVSSGAVTFPTTSPGDAGAALHVS